MPFIVIYGFIFRAVLLVKARLFAPTSIGARAHQPAKSTRDERLKAGVDQPEHLPEVSAENK